MIVSRFCIKKWAKHDHYEWNNEYYFIVRGESAVEIFEQAKDFFEEFKKNEELHLKTMTKDDWYDLHIVDYNGELEVK